jgi:hypothetical protein
MVHQAAPFNSSPKAQAAGVALGAYIDHLNIRNEVTYLVRNGIEVEDAVQRIVTYHRKVSIWGLSYVWLILWSSIGVGWAIRLTLFGLVQQQALSLLAGLLLFPVGLFPLYLMCMVHLRFWRTACVGIEWEDTRNPWLPSIRPPHLRVAAPPAAGDDGRRATAGCLSVVFVGIWLIPLLGSIYGTFQDLGAVS